MNVDAQGEPWGQHPEETNNYVASQHLLTKDNTFQAVACWGSLRCAFLIFFYINLIYILPLWTMSNIFLKFVCKILITNMAISTIVENTRKVLCRWIHTFFGKLSVVVSVFICSMHCIIPHAPCAWVFTYLYTPRVSLYAKVQER